LELRKGSPFVEIIRYARDEKIDLIVMGTHGRGPMAHLLLGSVAERVVRKAPCAVLTVRPAEHKFVRP
jgi:nucleotide-binding universal stress UspA family protein